MTILVGANFVLFGLMLADSRVSVASTSRSRASDVCEKMSPFSEAGLITWAGDLSLVHAAMNVLVDEHNRTHYPWFLLDQARLRALFADERLRSFPEGIASFIVQLINPFESAYSGQFEQRVDMSVIDVVTKGQRFMQFQRVNMDYVVRGSGALIEPHLAELDTTMRLWKATRTLDERSVINRCLILDEIVSELVRRAGAPGIGGLHQLAYLMNDRVRAVAYEKWLPISPWYGTRVKMVIDSGRWFQVHEPSQTKRQLFNPFIERYALERSLSRDILFDIEHLRSDSSGVLPTSRAETRPKVLSVHPVLGASSTTFRPLVIPSPSAYDPHAGH